MPLNAFYHIIINMYKPNNNEYFITDCQADLAIHKGELQ